MHTYLLGRHQGELPTHLLGTEHDGHRVFSVAALDGPDHTVFIGLKRDETIPAPESRPLSGSLSTGSGDPVSDVVVLVQCVDTDCLGLLPELPVNPCYLPEGWQLIVFVIVLAEHLRDALPRAHTRLREGAVAVATDGNGRFLVELAGNDRRLLQEALDELRSAPGVELHAPHWADGRALARA